MANPFKAALGGSQDPQRGQRNFAPALLHHLQHFQGDPMQKLQEKVSSSGITQDQYNQLYRAAESIAQRMMGVIPH